MKRKDRLRADNLYWSLEAISSPQDGDENTESLVAVQGQEVERIADSSRLPRLKRFRFQLLHQWLVHNFKPCRAADIGGGKGLLSYLLILSGWQATVIDPHFQPLPEKYKDIVTHTRLKIDPQFRIPCISAPFDTQHARGFDLLIGMHAHGCNAKIIDAAAEVGCGFVLFPCCVIDEPFVPPPGVHWLASLADYAVQQGHDVKPFRLNFKGQNIGIFTQNLMNKGL
jgi:hypothetical protein